MSDNRGPQVSGVCALFLVLTWIFTSMRVYTRLFLVKSFGLDDYLAVVAQLLFTFFTAFAITGVQYGTGQHAQNIQPPTNIPIGLKWWWACEPVYVLSNLAIKISICLFLLRIAVSRVQRVTLYVVMAVSCLMCFYFFFLFVFQCWPSSYFWEQYTGGAKGSCINPEIITISTYVYSAITCWSDWTCCILPWFMVWKLQMNPRTKISVCIILALSAVASAATIIRFPFVAGLSNTSDFLYATTDVAIWSITETGLGITAAGAATLRPLFRRFLSRSRLMGGDSTKEGSGAWPSSRAGYLRSGGLQNRRNDEEIGLRTDINKSVGVTTIIDGKSQHYSNDSGKNSEAGMVITEGASDWNESQSKLTDSSGDDFGSKSSWPRGIKKTTVVSTHRS